MITENQDSISFVYPFPLLEGELNLLSSYIAGRDADLLRLIEMNSGHREALMEILNHILPQIYSRFINASVAVKNGLSVNHDGVTVKVDRIKNGTSSAYSDNRIILIDGLLKSWIVRHALAEWLQLTIKDANLMTMVLRDDETIVKSLDENIHAISGGGETKSYTVTEITKEGEQE